MHMSSNEIDAHVGKRMRKVREALGLSQGRLGRQLDLTFSQVQKYEKGANRIGAGRLHVLARVLNVPVQYFFEELAEGPENSRAAPQACRARSRTARARRGLSLDPRRQHTPLVAGTGALARGAGRQRRGCACGKRLT